MFTNNHLRIVQEGVSIFLLLHVSKWSICIYIRIYFVLQIRLRRQRISLRTIVISLTEKAMAPHSSTFYLENPMDGGAWWAAVHAVLNGVAKSLSGLSDFTFTFHFHALEKEMATHSSVLAWRIPGTGEPGGLPSMGSHKVGHD